MEAWTIDKYRAPFLVCDRVIESTADSIDLQHGSTVVSVEGVSDADRVWVEQLRRPRSQAWANAALALHGRRDVVQSLDYLGLIADAVSVETPAVAEAVREERLFVESALNLAARWIRERVSEEDSAELARRIETRIAGLTGAEDALFEGNNFYEQVLVVQALYLASSAPRTLLACTELLRLLRSRTEGANCPQEKSVGLYGRRDLLTHLDAFSSSFVDAIASDERQRLFSLPNWSSNTWKSGSDFMRLVELAANEVYEGVPATRYLDAIRSPNADIVLAQATYQQEYHVTCRFVEMLTPMMHKRLQPQLRQRMFRYFAEEVGHESFEYASCRRLDLSDSQIRDTDMLPLHVAYVDAFTLVAQHNPTGYFASLFITEGSLGMRSPAEGPLAEILAPREGAQEQCAKHTTLNDELHHTSLSRLFFADVGAVSPAEQHAALGWVLFLQEINHRAWNALYARFSEPAPWGRRGPTASLWESGEA